MEHSELTVGEQVETNFADPGLPQGSVGEVKHVYDNLSDGADVHFNYAGPKNVMTHGLEPVAQPGR